MTDWTVAIDPGVRRCGVAVFHGLILVAACETNPREGQTTAACVRAFVRATITEGGPVSWHCERMTSYEGDSASEGTLNEIRAVVDDLEIPTRNLLRPSAWKAQVPKITHQKRIRRALSRTELRIVDSLPRTRDALDAVGIGLFVLGRIGRGGVRVGAAGRSEA